MEGREAKRVEKFESKLQKIIFREIKSFDDNFHKTTMKVNFKNLLLFRKGVWIWRKFSTFRPSWLFFVIYIYKKKILFFLYIYIARSPHSSLLLLYHKFWGKARIWDWMLIYVKRKIILPKILDFREILMQKKPHKG